MLFIYFVIIPVFWVALGGFSAGVLQVLSNTQFRTYTNLTLIMLAPLTFFTLLCILSYGYSLRFAIKIGDWISRH